MLQDSGKIRRSDPLYLEALRLNPNHEKSEINLGKMYLEMNPPDVDTALRLFKQAYDADNKSFEANNNLGSAYLAKKIIKMRLIIKCAAPRSVKQYGALESRTNLRKRRSVRQRESDVYRADQARRNELGCLCGAWEKYACRQEILRVRNAI